MAMTTLKTIAGGGVAALLMSVSMASAATLDLVSAPDGIGTHPEDTPCIISAINCPGQNGANDLDYTNYVAKGSDTTQDQNSPLYTVGEIFAIVGNMFSVGVDVNDTTVAQTLESFTMFVDGVARFVYTGFTDNVPNSNNGTGFADYLLTGFDLSAFSSSSTVQFNMKMSGLNDGPEQFFLVDAGDAPPPPPPPPPPIPIPAAGVLLLSALGGMGLYGRRKKSA